MMSVEGFERGEFNQDQLLLATDYDGTTNLTGEMGPGLVNIDGAYGRALQVVLGVQAADDYRDQGGHNSRTPAEIIHDLRPDMPADEAAEVTDLLVKEKLAVLIDQIGVRLFDGRKWPRMSAGFKTLWESVAEAPHVMTAVLSAGHVEFIEESFDVHGLAAPDIIVTDEMFPALCDEFDMPLPAPVDRAKPNPTIMELAKAEWLSRYSGVDTHTSLDSLRDQIIYVGDDQVKDGGLARNSGVDFYLLKPADAMRTWREVGLRLRVGDICLQGAINA